MAVEKNIAIDTDWEQMKDFAVEQQQYFYELLSDCTIYKPDEHKYLKQNIGYAIYGPPKSNEDTNTTKSSDSTKKTSKTKSHCHYKPENLNNTNIDITDTVDYDEKAKKIIDKLYKKICEHSIKIDSQPIYFGIIYIIIFRPKMKTKKKKKTEIKEEIKKEAKQEIEVKKVKENEGKLPIISLPIFKIRRSIQENFTKSTEQKQNTSTKVETDYETWYIDTNGRVYKSWANFTEDVNLPQCTMVAPKDGFYQPNSEFPITEDYSTVWVEIMDSPACSLKAKMLSGIDIASSAVGVGTISLGVASLFTPIGPVVAITGLAVAGTSGAWTMARSVQKLVNRNNHEESISLLDKEAFPHYLGIAGTVFGLGTMGGSVVISNAAAHGMTIPNYAKMAFNTVQGGNIVLNGIGVAYQGYCIIDKYLIEGIHGFLHTLYFATHLMFFAGSVVKLPFANDIIKSTQGKVLDDYRETLRSRRLREKFNRISRKAAENSTCKISENADVICYIKNREQLQIDQPANNGTLDKTSTNILWSFEQGKIRVSNIVLLDPIKFVFDLIQSDKFSETNQWNLSEQNYNDFMVDQLGKVLCDLLMKLYISDDYLRSEKLPILPDFEPLLKEINSMNINEEYLKKLFDMAVKLTQRSKNKENVLLLSFTFIWQYCKANLRKWGISSCYRIQSVSGCKILQKIITVIFEAINKILDDLYTAFLLYIDYFAQLN